MGDSYHADSQKRTQSMSSLQSLLSQIKPAAFTDKWCAILKDTSSENSGLTLAIKIISRQLNSFQWYSRRQTLKLYFTSSKKLQLMSYNWHFMILYFIFPTLFMSFINTNFQEHDSCSSLSWVSCIGPSPFSVVWSLSFVPNELQTPLVGLISLWLTVCSGRILERKQRRARICVCLAPSWCFTLCWRFYLLKSQLQTSRLSWFPPQYLLTGFILLSFSLSSNGYHILRCPSLDVYLSFADSSLNLPTFCNLERKLFFY